MKLVLPVVVLSVLACSVAFSAPVVVLTTDLLAGQTYDVGTVTVSRDDVTNAVSVLIETDDPFEMDETHLYVGSTAPTKAAPGRFPFMHEDLGWVTSNSYDLGVIGTGTFYVAVQAVVRENLGPLVDELLYPIESAWADGLRIRAKGPWATYFVITIPVIED